MRIDWRPQARSDLIDILDYISDRDISAARSLEARIYACVDRLPAFPDMHRPGRVAGTREVIVHPNYILIYQTTRQAIRILRVLHSRQQCP